MLTWVIRGLLALALIMLAVLALGGRSPAPTPTPTLIPTPAVLAAPPTATRPPTPTAEPFVQRIISRVARETQAPYPTSTPLPNGLRGVSVVDFGYMPSVLRLRVGQTVVWRNDGSEEHDITGEDWHSGPLEPTIDYRQTFGFAGTFKYRCSIHPDMTGTLVVDP